MGSHQLPKRHHEKIVGWAILILVLTANALPAQTSRSIASKKLIEFGWDEPDSAFMLKHIVEMEQTPFDGTVYHVDYTKPDGSRGRFMGECWGTRAFTNAELSQAAQELKQTRFKKFTQNFLRFNVLPGDVDWFDDFGAIVNNAKLSAHIAHEAKSRGILFDIEAYGHPLWNYPKQRDASTKSWDVYSKQAHQRGAEVMNAFQDGFGENVVVFLTFGYSLPWSESNGDASKLQKTEYGLLKPFLDGMLDAAKPGAKIIDGYEISYGYREAKQFADAKELVHRKLPSFGANADKYRQTVSLSFGLWLDYDWRKKGWDTKDVSKNHFTPEQFEKSLRCALETSDELVWIYTEDAKWWSDKGRVKLPEDYVRAIQRARKSN